MFLCFFASKFNSKTWNLICSDVLKTVSEKEPLYLFRLFNSRRICLEYLVRVWIQEYTTFLAKEWTKLG
jgi:hypothetical protein